MAQRNKKSDSDSDTDGDDEFMDDIDNVEDAIAKYEKINMPDVKRGMFVSGWDDPENDVSEEEEGPETPEQREMLHAAETGDIATINRLLKMDPTLVHARDQDKYTPLHRAAYENQLEVAKILLFLNADINAQTEFKWTPLHSACKWNHPDMVAFLLQHGADVNALSEGNQTPLHIAATVSDCREMMFALLYDENIKPDLLNNSGETAFAIARRTGSSYPIFDMVKPGMKVETGKVQ